MVDPTPDRMEPAQGPGAARRILHLTLHRRWFDAIARGEKKAEYRLLKPYWAKRLDGREYDEIHFRNGYASDAPFMRVEWVGLADAFYSPLGDDKHVFVIHLGKILEIRNYEAPEAPQGRGEPLGEPSKSSPSQAPEASA